MRATSPNAPKTMLRRARTRRLAHQKRRDQAEALPEQLVPRSLLLEADPARVVRRDRAYRNSSVRAVARRADRGRGGRRDCKSRRKTTSPAIERRTPARRGSPEASALVIACFAGGAAGGRPVIRIVSKTRRRATHPRTTRSNRDRPTSTPDVFQRVDLRKADGAATQRGVRWQRVQAGTFSWCDLRRVHAGRAGLGGHSELAAWRGGGSSVHRGYGRRTT